MPLSCRLPLPAAAWRIDDYLGGEEGEDGESDDDLDLASLRAHRLKFAKDRKDAMSRRWGAGAEQSGHGWASVVALCARCQQVGMCAAIAGGSIRYGGWAP